MKSQNRILELDSLRGLSAIMILFYHIQFMHKLPINNYLHLFMSRFSLGVPLFFTLSAFSIFYSFSDKELSKDMIRDYFCRRFFRIAPLYYVMMIVYIIYRSFNNTATSMSEICLNLSFSFNFSPRFHDGIVWAGWSIGIEFLFYILLPILFATIRDYKQAFFLGLLVLIVSVIYSFEYVTYLFRGHTFSYRNVIIMAPFFMLGILLHYIYKSDLMNYLKSKSYIILLFLILSIIGIYIITYYMANYKDNYWVLLINDSRFYLYYALIIFIFLILFLLTYSNKIFTNKYLVYTGEISYSIYLVHPIIVFYMLPFYNYTYALVQNSVISLCICCFLTLIITIPVASLTYYYIEKPGIKLGRKFIDRLNEKNSVHIS